MIQQYNIYILCTAFKQLNPIVYTHVPLLTTHLCASAPYKIHTRVYNTAIIYSD